MILKLVFKQSDDDNKKKRKVLVKQRDSWELWAALGSEERD